MPPKKVKSLPAASPLDGCTIGLSGTFSGQSQGAIEQRLIKGLGATLVKTPSAAKTITHMVASEADYYKTSTKVKYAQTNGVPIVKLQWLEDCWTQNLKVNERAYSFDASVPKANGSRKRHVNTNSDSEADEPQLQPNKKSKPMSGSQVAGTDISENTKAEEGGFGEAQIAKGDMKVPLDEVCPWTHYEVYIDDGGVIHDASLNQTNAGNNKNKFYRIQLLRNVVGDHKVWTRWGRVGERGQSATLGDGSLDDAMKQFDKKFKDKSGLSWENRRQSPKAKKYTFVERSYAPDSDGENDAANVKAEDEPAPESKLAPAVQDLMELIFNQQYFAATMNDLNYDVKKMPLGKLSKSTITRGYQALKDLSALLDNPALAASQHSTTYGAAVESLSNLFYSVIPHVFGRNRPPVIDNQAMLKREIELLDSLTDMKDASGIMKNEKDKKEAQKLNILDQQFRGLGLDEMTPLKSASPEFHELQNYLMDTKGATHNTNYQISQIFRIERQGDKDRFETSEFGGPPRDRRLLWHGSRCTNFGGILSQGLRIAPPEAPVSGYMFGKGIYLADMSSKSANYCCSYNSNGHALLLLCEAELGDPMQELTNSSYDAGDDAKTKGMSSTWGKGTTGPLQWKDAECVHPSLKGVKMPDTRVKPGPTGVPNACLLYNEYITYDVSQVRLRYLLRVRM